MSVPNDPISAQHSRHDRMLVARFAAGDAGAQEHEAQDLIRHCPECAALAADISAIANAVAQLPAAPRTQDFRLTADQADHLRGSRFDRWLRTLTGSGWATVRPVAAVALSIGLVMSVAGGLPMLNAAAPSAADQGASFVAAAPSTEAGAIYSHGTRTGPVVAATPPVPAVSTQLQASPPSVGASGPGAVPSMGDTASRTPVGGATASPATESFNSAYLPQSPTTAPDGQNNTAPQHPQPTPSSATDIATQLPASGPSSGPSSLLLFAGIGVTLVALIALVALYAARRRYDDPLLR